MNMIVYRSMIHTSVEKIDRKAIYMIPIFLVFQQTLRLSIQTLVAVWRVKRVLLTLEVKDWRVKNPFPVFYRFILENLKYSLNRMCEYIEVTNADATEKNGLEIALWLQRIHLSFPPLFWTTKNKKKNL